MYALVQGGDLIAYPYSDYQLRRDNANVSFPAEMDDETRADFGMIEVEATPVPSGKIAVATAAELVGGAWIEVHTLEDPPPPSANEVDAERDRRIAAGFTFGGKSYQSRPDDRENIAGSSTAALAAMVNGAQPGNYRWHGGDSDFVWIAADNSLTTMDAQTMFTFGQAAMAHKQAHIFAARALKDAEPIPADYADNIHWP